LILLNFSIFSIGQTKINNQLSINSQKTLHYYLKDLVIENKRFSNSGKSELDKQYYQGMLISYKKIISLSPNENSPSVDVLVKIAKGSDLKKSSILFNQHYHTSSKYDFITASIKITDIEELAQEESVLYIEPSFIIQQQLLNSINDINTPDVWSGYCNLVDKIDGTGVIVGILDTKINRDHITFQDADEQTRILNYDEIGGNPEAHGTHVASIAAGRGDAAGNWKGVAYNSNIYWKSTGNTNDILNNFQWMIDQSGSTPLVVNLSAGYKLGPHDGTTEFETLLDSKINGNKFFINSCGNYKSNEYYMHYQDELPSSSTLSFSVNLDSDPLPLHTGEDYSNNEFKMEIWYDGDYSIDVKIREPDGNWSEWVDFGNSLNYDFPGDGKVHIFNDGTCYDAGQNYGNGDNVIFFDFFDPWPGDHIVKTGDYIIQLRDHDNNNSGSCIINAYNTLECIDYDEENIDAISFVGGDFYQTISSPSYASKVISVAACQKENYGGDISSYSSVGPARNDMASVSKPDITAPGGNTPSDLAMIIAANYQSTTLFNTGMAGTSQAAPHVSGAIALLLQNFPDITALEVKNILQVSSRALPNGHSYENGTITNEELKFWGSGKLNILNAYKYMVGYISQSEYDQAFQDAFNNHPYLTGLPVEKVNTNWFLHNKQRLTNGAIFLKANTVVAYWLGEEIWNAWESLGHLYSGLGMPTCSEYIDASNNNYKTVDFQYGHIYWNGSNAILVPDYTDFSDSLNINNINAGIRADGYLFADIIEVPDQSIEFLKPHFEYPNGSGKSTIFCNSFWIGGLDNNNNLCIAAQRYKQVGWDYQAGPMSNNYDENFKVKWNKLWKVDKTEVNYHKNNYWKEDYVPVPDIINWPGNGDVNEGQSANLAPYFDQDQDGIYEPMQGDYPIIRGDQTVFFMFNDDRPHGETGGNRLKIEIHGMAYAYSMPSNQVMNNSVYIHYDIINRSNKTYNNTYIGIFADTDIGFAQDDFVASNVQNGSFITYNGDEIDGQGEPGSYGANPPAQSITVLAGPFMDHDQADNPDGGCNYSVNGLNFGDGVVDNERLGMTGFIYFGNSSGSQGDPQFAAEYYNYLQMKWRDDTKMQYGGAGHIGYSGTVGPECNFMLPGNSDPTNWGSYCLLPNGGYNQNGKYWSEETGDNGNPNPPGDRRGLLTTGPFTFKPGDVQELEMAYVIGQGSDGPMTSVVQLNENLESIFASVEAGDIIVPNAYLATPEYTADIDHVQVYPNPACTSITFNCHALANETIIYEIYSITGNQVIQGKCKGSQSVNLNIQNLNNGIYILVIKNINGLSRVKFVKN